MARHSGPALAPSFFLLLLLGCDALEVKLSSRATAASEPAAGERTPSAVPADRALVDGGGGGSSLASLQSSDPTSYSIVKNLLMKRSLKVLDFAHPSAAIDANETAEVPPRPRGAAAYAGFVTPEELARVAEERRLKTTAAPPAVPHVAGQTNNYFAELVAGAQRQKRLPKRQEKEDRDSVAKDAEKPTTTLGPLAALSSDSEKFDEWLHPHRHQHRKDVTQHHSSKMKERKRAPLLPTSDPLLDYIGRDRYQRIRGLGDNDGSKQGAPPAEAESTVNLEQALARLQSA